MCPAWNGMHQHKAALVNKALEDWTNLQQCFSNPYDKDRGTGLPGQQQVMSFDTPRTYKMAKQT